MRSSNIIEIIKNGHCTGCCVCSSVCSIGAVEITKDKYGFIVPNVNLEKCVQCGRCRKVCPAIINNYSVTTDSYAAVTKNVVHLMRSSSGGIFPAIAESILDDGGVVYGATMDQTFKVSHIRIEDKNALNSILGSKYIQSYTGHVYEEIEKDLKAGRTVLFSGTPCLVSAVKNYCVHSNNGLLFTVDVVCHGTPSQEFFDSYLEYLNRINGEIGEYRFRAKRYTNNGMNWFFSLRKKAEKKAKLFNWPEDPFNYMYMKSYIYRDSCYKCKYANPNRVGDITLCDFWGWEKYHREFPLGSTVSGILINSEVGKILFDKIKVKLNWVDTKIDNILDNNSCLVKPVERPIVRNNILDEWVSDGFIVIADKYGLKNKNTIVKSQNLAGEITGNNYFSYCWYCTLC